MRAFSVGPQFSSRPLVKARGVHTWPLWEASLSSASASRVQEGFCVLMDTENDHSTGTSLEQLGETPKASHTPLLGAKAEAASGSLILSIEQALKSRAFYLYGTR